VLSTVHAADGTELATEHHLVPECRGRLVIVHGYAEHKGRYAELVASWSRPDTSAIFWICAAWAFRRTERPRSASARIVIKFPPRVRRQASGSSRSI